MIQLWRRKAITVRSFDEGEWEYYNTGAIGNHTGGSEGECEIFKDGMHSSF